MNKPLLIEQTGEIPFGKLDEYDHKGATFQTEMGGLEDAVNYLWGHPYWWPQSCCHCHEGDLDKDCECDLKVAVILDPDGFYRDEMDRYDVEPIDLVIIRDDLENTNE